MGFLDPKHVDGLLLEFGRDDWSLGQDSFISDATPDIMEDCAEFVETLANELDFRRDDVLFYDGWIWIRAELKLVAFLKLVQATVEARLPTEVCLSVDRVLAELSVRNLGSLALDPNRDAFFSFWSECDHRVLDVALEWLDLLVRRYPTLLDNCSGTVSLAKRNIEAVLSKTLPDRHIVL